MANVKGIWVLNEELDLDDTSVTRIDQVVEYVSLPSNSYSTYSVFTIIFSAREGLQEIQYKYFTKNNASLEIVVVYSGSKGWYSDGYRTIDFGSTPQEVPDEFYTWLTANATQQESSDDSGGDSGGSGGATVAYNGSDLLSLEAGQTGTLNCAGTKMAGDVVVSFEGVGSVAYNGSVIASLSAGQIATLYCAGKKMAGNIVITCDGGGSN